MSHEVKATTLAIAEENRETGVAVAINQQGNIVLLGLVDGEIEWGHEFSTEIAEKVAGLLLERASQARAERAS